MWFGPLSWTRPNADRVRMSRRYDMGEQDTTLLSLPKIALITLNPKRLNCRTVYWSTCFGWLQKHLASVSSKVRSWTCLYFKKVWIGNTLPPCPIEKCNIILVSLSLSRTGALCPLSNVNFFFCSQKVKANLSMTMSMNAWTWKKVNTLY